MWFHKGDATSQWAPSSSITHVFLWQNQHYGDVFNAVCILLKHDDMQVCRQAEIVYEYLKPKSMNLLL